MTSCSSVFSVAPGGVLRGRVRVPGDKSISHRAIMLGAIAEGTTEVSGFLEGEDALATLAAFRALGVSIEGPADGRLRIHGVGLRGLSRAPATIDLGNSGTAMRLMAGVLAGQRFDSVLAGDASLSTRPMRRVCEPLERMGASIETADGGTPPLHIAAREEPLRSIEYRLPVASAQVKSAVLLAGLYARGRTCVAEPGVTRDHTERMLQTLGCPVTRSDEWICVDGNCRLEGSSIAVPGDFSSAAFFLVGASIAPGSDLTVEAVGVNPTRTGALDILRLMGADLSLENRRDFGAEPVADIRVRHAPLRGIEIPEALVPLAIDEFPALLVAAACASGPTVLRGARELRVKESDRLQSMADGLAALGVATESAQDGISVTPGPFTGAEVDSRGDHRIAMAFAMAGLKAGGPVRILDCRNVATSFPGFADTAAAAGLRIGTGHD